MVETPILSIRGLIVWGACSLQRSIFISSSYESSQSISSYVMFIFIYTIFIIRMTERYLFVIHCSHLHLQLLCISPSTPAHLGFPLLHRLLCIQCLLSEEFSSSDVETATGPCYHVVYFPFSPSRVLYLYSSSSVIPL